MPSNPNTFVKKGQLHPTLKAFDIHVGPIAAPANGAIVIELHAHENYKLTAIAAKTRSGTCSVGLRINGADVNFVSGLSTSTTLAVTSASIATTPVASAGTVTPGSKLELVVSAGSSPVNLNVSVSCNQEGASTVFTTIYADPNYLFAFDVTDPTYATYLAQFKQQLLDAGVGMYRLNGKSTYQNQIDFFNTFSAADKKVVVIDCEFPWYGILEMKDTATEYPEGSGNFNALIPAAIPANDTQTQARIREEATRQGIPIIDLSTYIATQWKALAVKLLQDIATYFLGNGADIAIHQISVGYSLTSDAAVPVEGIRDNSLLNISYYDHDPTFIKNQQELSDQARTQGKIRSIVQAQRTSSGLGHQQFDSFPSGLPVPFVSKWTCASYCNRLINGDIPVNPDFVEPDYPHWRKMGVASILWYFRQAIQQEVTDGHLLSSDLAKPMAMMVYVPPIFPWDAGQTFINHLACIIGSDPEHVLIDQLADPDLDTPNVQQPQWIFAWDLAKGYLVDQLVQSRSINTRITDSLRIGFQKFALKMPLVNPGEPIGDRTLANHDLWNQNSSLGDAWYKASGSGGNGFPWWTPAGGSQLPFVNGITVRCEPGTPLDPYLDFSLPIYQPQIVRAWSLAITKVKVDTLVKGALHYAGL